MNYNLSLVISTLAGLATCLGIIFTFIKVKNINKIIVFSLSMAMGVMFLISIKELIFPPITYILDHNNIILSLFIIISLPILAITMLNFTKIFIKKESSLYRVGILNAVSLFIHNVPEGIATFASSITNVNLGLKLAIGIALHNLPEGISIAVPIYYSTKNRKKALLYTFISGMAEFFGALLTMVILKNYLNNNILCIILYFIGCLMLLISLTEIRPEILKYKEKRYILYGLIVSLFILLV